MSSPTNPNTYFANAKGLEALFGKRAFKDLMGLMDPCCSNEPGSFCADVLECLGISDGGDPDLVLNQQGNWVAGGGGGTPAGNDMEIQFNDSGVFGASSSFTYDDVDFQFKVGTGSTNGNRLDLDDLIEQILWISSDYYVIQNNVGNVRFAINETAGSYGFGDITNADNGNKLVIADASNIINIEAGNTFRVKNLTPLTMLEISMTTPSVSIGDTANNNNGNNFTINDSAETAILETGDSGEFIVRNVDNTTPLLRVSQMAGLVNVGDYTNALANNTFITVNCNTGELLNRCGTFRVKNTSDNNVITATSNLIVALGDIDSAGNDTYLAVNDNGQEILARTGGNIVFTDVSNNQLLRIETTGPSTIKLGDIDGVSAGTRLEINPGGSGSFSFRDNNTARCISYDGSVTELILGDVDNLSNSTKIRIDDAGEQIILLGGSTNTTALFVQDGASPRITAAVDGEFTVSDVANLVVPLKIDTVAGRINIDVPAFADDAAAGVGTLVAGDVYQTTGAGAAPLNVAGILMVKQ